MISQLHACLGLITSVALVSSAPQLSPTPTLWRTATGRAGRRACAPVCRRAPSRAYVSSQRSCVPWQKEPTDWGSKDEPRLTALRFAGCSGLIARWTDEVASLAPFDPSHSTCFVYYCFCVLPVSRYTCGILPPFFLPTVFEV